MPIKNANIEFKTTNVEEKDEKSESELRKEAWNQIFKDARTFSRTASRIFFLSVFLYGLFSLLQDVNVI